MNLPYASKINISKKSTLIQYKTLKFILLLTIDYCFIRKLFLFNFCNALKLINITLNLIEKRNSYRMNIKIHFF